jgi:ketosteroid isomerase-like protein
VLQDCFAVDDNAQTIRAWFEALNQSDIDALLGLMSPDVHFAPGRTGTSKVYHGRDEVRQFFDEAEEWFGRPVSAVLIEDVHMVGDSRTVTSGYAAGRDSDFVAVHDFADDGLISAAQLYMGSDLETLRGLGMI